MNKTVVIIGGHGGKSGVPKYVSHLSSALFKNKAIVISDINYGGYDFIEKDHSRYFQIEGLASGSNLAKKAGAFVKLFFLLKQLKPDVVWANSSVSVLFTRLIYLVQLKKFTIVVTYHGLPFGPGRRRILSFIMHKLEVIITRFLSNEKIVLLSLKDVDLFRKIHHPSNAYFVTGNPVVIDKSLFKKNHSSGPIRLVMTTRASFQKNLDLAVEIFGHLENAELHIFGNMNDKKLSLPDNVFVHGEHHNPAEMLEHFDCYLMTSFYEGFPLGALEARGVGLCLAMTDVGGIDELVIGRPYAVSLALDDAATSAIKIQKMVEKYRRDEDAFCKVRQSCAEFSVDAWVEKNMEVLDVETK